MNKAKEHCWLNEIEGTLYDSKDAIRIVKGRNHYKVCESEWRIHPDDVPR